MVDRRLTLLGVPIDSVGEAGGTEGGPTVLRELLASAALDDAGDTTARIRSRIRDPSNGWLAFEDNLEVTTEVRERVAGLAAAGRTPLILGGCCALVPGALAGLRDAHGEIGLAYVDGHLDLFTGDTSPTGEGADMPVATALGFAPEAMLDRLGVTPLVEPSRVALAGARDRDELELIRPWPDRLGVGPVETREQLGRSRLEAAGREVAEAAGGRAAGAFWLHLDVDVLDRSVFPATDYLMDDGLDLPALRKLLRPIGAAKGLSGISVACYNPDKDPDGSCGRTLANLMSETLIP